MIPKNISKVHLIHAIEEIEKKGISQNRNSSKFDLIYNGKQFPPKLVISKANKFANGSELDSTEFSGGTETNTFLEKNGFEIISKENPIQSIIDGYKKLISKTKLKDEIYKWELLKEYKGRPNPEKTNFYQEIKDTNFNNLIYHLGKAILSELAEKKPLELRKLFLKLFDESIDLKERVNSFDKESLQIYRSLGKKLSHHQDERSIATYLTFHNSEKYTFYKYSYYKKYCSYLGVKEAKKNERYNHYLKLTDELIEEYIESDLELIEKVKKLLPNLYDGLNHKLLAQDIIYQMFEKNGATNYWVFQGNPQVFDFKTALKEELLNDWTVTAHKDKIKVGDKVIIWITGNDSGCYALAEITSEPYEKTSSLDDHLWKDGPKNELKAELKITHNLFNNPILKPEIETMEELKNLKVGNQGTNFSATEDEYETVLKLIDNTNSFTELKLQFDDYAFDNYIQFLRRVITDLNLMPNDNRVVFSIQGRSLNFTVGQRYAFNLFLANPKGLYGVMSKEVINESSVTFAGNSPQPFYSYFNTFNPNDNEYHLIIDAIRDELSRITKSGFLKHNNTDFEKFVFESIKNNMLKLSLNTILYGPPGTGKTYFIRNRYMDFFTSSENSITRQDFLIDLIQKCSWWQVIALAVLDLGKTKVNDILNHELVKIKSQLSNSTTVPQTIWGQLQSHTIEECKHVNVQRRMTPLIFNKTEKSEWEILRNELSEQSPDLLELKSKIENFDHIPNKKIERFEFVTFHQSYSYEDFIEGIKPELSESDISYKIEDGVFLQLCNRARNDSSNKYALFIDEINRGNISSIFGELITLIEDDKREGNSNELKVTLPYSKKHFSVPKNVYIIGTMNTADRSVEALDTALRRRFSFIEMNPDPSKLNSSEFECSGIDLEAFLTTINARIEKLLDKDYCIGHSYFMTIKNRNEPLEEIKSIFQNKVLPLLQEYFYGDWGKIQLVLGKKFVEAQLSTIKFLPTDSFDDFEEYDEKLIYRFTNPENWTLDSFKSIYE